MNEFDFDENMYNAKLYIFIIFNFEGNINGMFNFIIIFLLYIIYAP